MWPVSIPIDLFKIFAIGAKQFVVQDAFEIILWLLFISLWFTPYTTVISGLSDGAEIITFFAPAFICCKESFFEVKIPVHSITISILFFFHGNLSGFVSEII